MSVTSTHDPRVDYATKARPLPPLAAIKSATQRIVMEENSEAGITTPIGSLNFKGKRMAEFIALFCLTALFMLGYVMYEHKADTKEEAKGMKDALSSGFKEMAAAQREQNSIQREQLCLLSLPESRRQQEFLNDGSFCKRLSRER